MTTFTKEERLCSRKVIDALFANGHRLMAFPFSIYWQALPADAEGAPFEGPAQVLIVAPKRKLHHAVQRNRAKRLMRECYRLRKDTLYTFLQQHHLRLVLSFTYIHTDIFAFDRFSTKFDKAFDSLLHDIEASLAPTEASQS